LQDFFNILEQSLNFSVSKEWLMCIGTTAVFRHWWKCFCCVSTCRGRLHDISVEKWQIVDDTVKQNLARMASTAAWGLG